MRLGLAAALALSLGLVATRPARADEAKEVWVHHCKGCHGLDGRADTPMGHKHKTPDMTTAKFKADPKHDDAHMRDAIANGVPNTKMKSFKNKLSPAEIDALVAYIHTLQGK